MKNLIKGDIRRIMCKRSFWIAFIAFVIVLFYLFGMNYSSLNYLQGNIDGMGDLGGTVLGVAVFLAVYADDFKSMTIISVIGRGNSRLKVILAKFINSVLVTLLLLMAAYTAVIIHQSGFLSGLVRDITMPVCRC